MVLHIISNASSCAARPRGMVPYIAPFFRAKCWSAFITSVARRLPLSLLRFTHSRFLTENVGIYTDLCLQNCRIHTPDSHGAQYCKLR